MCGRFGDPVYTFFKMENKFVFPRWAYFTLLGVFLQKEIGLEEQNLNLWLFICIAVLCSGDMCFCLRLNGNIPEIIKISTTLLVMSL